MTHKESAETASLAAELEKLIAEYRAIGSELRDEQLRDEISKAAADLSGMRSQLLDESEACGEQR